jgi:protein-disulfide isomerase
MGRLAAAVLAFFALAAAAAARAAPDEDMSLGSPKAAVTVIEYASPTCPHCARFNAEVFPAFKAKWVDTGKVRYVLREAPIHPDLDAAGYLLARCAGPANYFKVVDALMRAQSEYYGPNVDGEDGVATAYRGALFRIAGSVGLSQSKSFDCMTDQAGLDSLFKRTDREMAQYDVHMTPTFVVNGVKIAEQDVDLAALDAAIQSAQAPHAHARKAR